MKFRKANQNERHMGKAPKVEKNNVLLLKEQQKKMPTDFSMVSCKIHFSLKFASLKCYRGKKELVSDVYLVLFSNLGGLILTDFTFKG